MTGILSLERRTSNSSMSAPNSTACSKEVMVFSGACPIAPRWPTTQGSLSRFCRTVNLFKSEEPPVDGLDRVVDMAEFVGEILQYPRDDGPNSAGVGPPPAVPMRIDQALPRSG